MVVDDAVKALVDIIEHVHHLHGRAVLTQSGEAHNVTEVYGHLIIQLWLHHACLLQAFYYRAAQRRKTKHSSTDFHTFSSVPV